MGGSVYYYEKSERGVSEALGPLSFPLWAQKLASLLLTLGCYHNLLLWLAMVLRVIAKNFKRRSVQERRR